MCCDYKRNKSTSQLYMHPNTYTTLSTNTTQLYCSLQTEPLNYILGSKFQNSNTFQVFSGNN
jgi:hypothetical protein